MQFSAVAALALLMLTSHVAADTDDRICSDDDNPLNLAGQYKLPSEQTSRGGWLGAGASKQKPEDMIRMVLKWIPRDSVSCAANQLSQEEQLARFKFTENENYNTISAAVECQNFVWSWLNKMKDTILYDLLIVVKAKSIDFFNEYYELKLSTFGPDKLISDLDEGLIGILEKLRQDLQDGFILPQDAKKPSVESFNQTLGEAIQIYRSVENMSSRRRWIVTDCKYSANKDREESRKECLQTVLAHAMGRSTSEPDERITVGYGDYTYSFDRGIKVMQESFGGKSEYKSNLPHLAPCFKD